MPNLNIEKMKTRILAEKERLEGDRLRILDHGGEGISDHVSELADFDMNHPGDVATETFEREKDSALHENLNGMLGQIHDALEKIERGTYGTCDRCNRPIAAARLEALPYATLCIECQGRVENQ